ncbi:MAG: TatD family hydrolase [Thiolinea sp.]
MIDTHCHFDDASFALDRAQVLTEMQALGVSDLIIPAVTQASWGGIQALCKQHSQLHAAYGLHPIYLAEHQDEHLKQLELFVREHREQVVAMGECGLDFYLPELAVQQQTALFIAQLKLAKNFDLPLIVHARRSVDAVLSCIRRVGGLRGVVHSFAGSQQQADQLMEQGFYLGSGGTLTYERAQRLRQILAKVPVDCLLLETDAPDQPDSQWRGQRNTPLRLPIIAEALAELRGCSLAELADSTTKNAQRLFGIV